MVWCLLRCLAFDSRQGRRRLLANDHTGFKVRLIAHQGLQTIFEHFLTDDINIKLLDVLAFFPCLCNIGLFSGVEKAGRSGKGVVILTTIK